MDTLILDHHLLRCEEGLPCLDRLSSEAGHRVICAADFMGRPRRLLEARRGLILGVLNRWSVLGLQRRVAGLFHQTVCDAARFYGVGELERLLRSVAGREACVVWRTTLFPRQWPWSQARLPWGGFIGMALVVSDGFREVG